MNEICIQILREKPAEIKKQAEAVDDANLHDAVHALENAFDQARRVLQGEDMQ